MDRFGYNTADWVEEGLGVACRTRQERDAVLTFLLWMDENYGGDMELEAGVGYLGQAAHEVAAGRKSDAV